jgi:sulfur-oxidizing protein SoxY
VRVNWSARRVNRRLLLSGGSAALILGCWPLGAFGAGEARLREAIARIVGNVDAILPGRVTIAAPAVADDGSAVLIRVLVESPMTEADHVASLHVFASANPRPYVGLFRLSPLLGKADIQTRIRLAETQRILAIAQMSDGTSWTGGADVTVTAGGGCGAS